PGPHRRRSGDGRLERPPGPDLLLLPQRQQLQREHLQAGRRLPHLPRPHDHVLPAFLLPRPAPQPVASVYPRGLPDRLLHLAPPSANAAAASTLGPIEPVPNSPAARRDRASPEVIRSTSRRSGVPKPSYTPSTSVRMSRASASTSRARMAAARSLSTTPSTP